MAQQVEHVLGKDEVPGSNPGISSKQNPPQTRWVLYCEPIKGIASPCRKVRGYARKEKVERVETGNGERRRRFAVAQPPRGAKRTALPVSAPNKTHLKRGGFYIASRSRDLPRRDSSEVPFRGVLRRGEGAPPYRSGKRYFKRILARRGSLPSPTYLRWLAVGRTRASAPTYSIECKYGRSLLAYGGIIE